MAASLPAALRASAVPRWSHRDPVEGGNPFPPADTRHGTWDDATVDARQALLRFDADLEATAEITLGPALYRAQLLDLAVGRFDIWARRGRSVVSSRDALRDYERWLEDYVANWLRYVAETCPHVVVGDELRTRLRGRAAHWVTETRNALGDDLASTEPAAIVRRRIISDGSSRVKRAAAWREVAAVVGGFAVLTALMTYPLVRDMRHALPGDLGDPLLNAWVLAWDADRILHGLRGLWQAPVFFPYPDTLAYSEHLLGIAVWVAPVQWVFDNFILTYNVAFLGSYVLAGAGMYLLVSSLTGNRWAAVVSGVAFAFCPYRAGQISHLQVLMSGWMPIGLWALHRYLAFGRRRALVGFAAAFLIQGLSNGYFLYFFTVPVCLVVAHALIWPRRPRQQTIIELTAAGLGAGVVLAPFAWVYLRLRQEMGFVRQPGEILGYSADLSEYLHVSPLVRVWGQVLESGRAEIQLFTGFTVLALSACAIGWLSVGHNREPSGTASAVSRPLTTSTATMMYAVVAIVALVLSLGPEPQAWGRSLFPVGPYQWLVAVVPGWDGLRVTARIATIVFLALSVLAGLGFAALTRRWSVWARMVGGIACACVVAVEGYSGPLAAASLRPHLHEFDDAAYDWLAERPRGGVLELPTHGEEPVHSLLFQHRTLQHRQPIVNGFSGWISPLSRFMGGPATPLFEFDQMGPLLIGLRQLGVRYLVVHERQYEDPQLVATTLEALRMHDDQVSTFHRMGPTWIVELHPYTSSFPSRPDIQLIPNGAFRAQASALDERLPLAFDGNVNTRWFTGDRQSGDEWVQVEFDEPRTVRRIRFEVSARSMGDYPRRLRVESSVDGERFDQVLFEDSVLTALVVGTGRNRGATFIDIDLPSVPSRALRLRQIGQTRAWYWSIDELTFWEAAEPRSEPGDSG